MNTLRTPFCQTSSHRAVWQWAKSS